MTRPTLVARREGSETCKAEGQELHTNETYFLRILMTLNTSILKSF